MTVSSLKQHAHHLDKKLRFRLRLYFLIAAILFIILIYNVIRGALRLDYGLLSLIAGIGIGIITSRMFNTSWNKNTQKIVTNLDTFGVGILLLYIVFEFLRGSLVGFFTHGVEVATVGLALLAGVMIGRVIGTRGKIIEILREQKVFK